MMYMYVCAFVYYKTDNESYHKLFWRIQVAQGVTVKADPLLLYKQINGKAY